MSILFGLSPHKTTAAGRHQQRPGWAAKTDEPHRRRRNSPFRRFTEKNAFATKDHWRAYVFHRGQRLSSRLCLGMTLLKRNMMLAVLILSVTIVTKMTSTSKRSKIWCKLLVMTPLLQNQCYQLYFTQWIEFFWWKIELTKKIECKYVHSLVLGRKSNTVPLLTLTFGLGVISIKTDSFSNFV